MGIFARPLPESSFKDMESGNYQLLFASAEDALEKEFLASFKKRKAHFTKILPQAYPKSLVENLFSYVKFTERSSGLKQKNISSEQISPFVTQHLGTISTLSAQIVPNCSKHVLMKTKQKKWYLTQTSLSYNISAKSHHLFY